jgi:hypothetical protein
VKPLRVLSLWFGLIAAGVCHGQDKSTNEPWWEIYTIDQSSVSHSRPVAFSVGYPKGWNLNASSPPETTGIVKDQSIICTFHSPERPPLNTMAVLRSWRENAKSAAEHFVLLERRLANGEIKVPVGTVRHTVIDLEPVKTAAGDDGYLVVSKEDDSAGVLCDYFFHHGPKGSLHIIVETDGADLSLREKLQHLVLDTLRF